MDNTDAFVSDKDVACHGNILLENSMSGLLFSCQVKKSKYFLKTHHGVPGREQGEKEKEN